MRLTSIRRYPVKAMGGEALDRVSLDLRGLAGDRWYAVTDAEGHFASGKKTTRFRRHDEVFGFSARTAGDGAVEVTDGKSTWRVGDEELDAHLTQVMGEPMHLQPEGEVLHQDDGQVSIIGTATLDWCARELGVDADPRRLRANLVVETDEPFVEEGWAGREVRIGSAVLTVVGRVERCRTIDLEQDGVDGTTLWLKPLGKTRRAQVAVYADVTTSGELSVGDEVVVGDG